MKNIKQKSGLLVLTLVLGSSVSFSQVGRDGKEENANKLKKESGAFDRAANISNASNIGMFWENRGKMYPRSNSQGPSGEFPINSQKNYIYKMNPIVAFPNNVISGQSSSIEEWEAAAGYHSSSGALIASSTDPSTWPSTGWPTAFRTEGDGTIDYLSEQTLYAVYNDSSNQLQRLGIEIGQTSYAFGSKPFDNFIIFKFDVKNNSANTYDKMYFGLHHDIDVGNYSGGDPEYGDDYVGYDPALQLVYFYDDGYSSEWAGGTTGFFGVSFIKTPKVNGNELGLTDWHYSVYEDDNVIQANDTALYQLLSSSPTLYNSPLGPLYFHPGANLPSIKKDDVSLIPISGGDYSTKLGSGPYSIGPNQTLTFVIAVVAGETKDALFDAATQAKLVDANDFTIPKPPKSPKLNAISGDGYIKLFWNSESEQSIDPFTHKKDFQGFRLYKSIDNGITWDQVDRNAQRSNPPPYPQALKEWDIKDGILKDNGIEYYYVDSSVVNGIEYWYTLTAFDYDASLGISSLESSLGRTSSQSQLAIAKPKKSFAGYSGIDINAVNHKSGISNDSLVLNFENLASLEGLSDTVNVELLYKKKAQYNGKETLLVINHALFPDDEIAIVFSTTTANLNANRYKIFNVSKNINLSNRIAYNIATTINFLGVSFSISDSTIRPQTGDTVFFFPGIKISGNNTTKLPLVELENNKSYFTTDGMEIKIQKADFVTDYLQISGSVPLKLSFTYTDTSKLKYQVYTAKVVSSFLDAESKARIILEVKSDDGLIAVTDTVSSSDYLLIPGVKINSVYDNTSIETAPQPNSMVTFRMRKPYHITLTDQWVIGTGNRGYSNSLAKTQQNNIRVVPNPYISSSYYEKAISKEVTKDVERQIRFINLPKNSEIHIFTLNGNKIKTLHNGLEGEIFWNLLNDFDREIASGMYIYQVKSDAGSFVGKFGVIK